MIRSKTYIAIPPGETIREQLDNHNMAADEFACKMDLQLEDANRLLNGEIELSEELAYKLESVFNLPTSFWNKLEATYRKKLLKIEIGNTTH